MWKSPESTSASANIPDTMHSVRLSSSKHLELTASVSVPMELGADPRARRSNTTREMFTIAILEKGEWTWNEKDCPWIKTKQGEILSTMRTSNIDPDIMLNLFPSYRSIAAVKGQIDPLHEAMMKVLRAFTIANA